MTGAGALLAAGLLLLALGLLMLVAPGPGMPVIVVGAVAALAGGLAHRSGGSHERQR